MDPNQFQDFLPLVTGFLGGATSAGVFAGPIQTLQDWWYINYGHNVSDRAALLRAKNEIDVENLKNSTLQEVATIPPENIRTNKNHSFLRQKEWRKQSVSLKR